MMVLLLFGIAEARQMKRKSHDIGCGTKQLAAVCPMSQAPRPYSSPLAMRNAQMLLEMERSPFNDDLLFGPAKIERITAPDGHAA